MRSGSAEAARKHQLDFVPTDACLQDYHRPGDGNLHDTA
jgi:hypothetical protein